MALFVVALVVLGVLALFALYVLRRAAIVTPHEAARAYDPDEAVAFVWEDLAGESRERLSLAGVKRLLGYQLDFMRQAGAIVNGKRAEFAAESIVVGGDDSIAYTLERAADAGFDVEPSDVREVVSALVAYLVAIGAVEVA